MRVLTFTFDNGFLSDAARRNIQAAVESAGVDHQWFRPSWRVQRGLYRISLLQSGELCSPCGIGMVNGYLRVSQQWRIPLVLLGFTPGELGTGSPEGIYDGKRFQRILFDAGVVDQRNLRPFLTYEESAAFLIELDIFMGRLGLIVHPLMYLEAPSEAEVALLLQREMGWEDHGKHADCLAEPFTNLVREKRLGYPRRTAHLSTMIRTGEISRDEALRIIAEDDSSRVQESTRLVQSLLALTDSEMMSCFQIPRYRYGSRASRRLAFLARCLRAVNRSRINHLGCI